MINYTQLSNDYARIEQVIYYIEKNASHQPDLSEIAAYCHMSEYHLQRLFTNWVGISPKRFLQFITKEHARQLLLESTNLLNTTHQVGLSSPGRLHDLFITWEAVSPGEFKMRGNGLTIHYGFHHTTFGEILLARTDRGICHISFIMTGGRSEALESLKKTWPLATLVENPHLNELMIEQVFPSTIQNVPHSLHLHLTGTNFQLKVWEALLRIPSGCVVSYRDIAGYLGNPGASRAVGNALAHNPVALLIPCHRVIQSLGGFGNYHYGEARKVAMLGWEMAKAAYPEF